MTAPSAILALIEAAPGEIAAQRAVYEAVKPALRAGDRARLETALAQVSIRLEADVARLARDVVST
ncbi:MAG: hypothetical protein ABI376_03695 [Caulobacteraceae bacterium]